MNGKKLFFVFLCGLYFLLPFLTLHTSGSPEVWRWSQLYFFIVIFYAVFVVLCTVLYFFFDQFGGTYCVFLIIFYGLSLVLIDFIIGSKNFYKHTKMTEHPIYHHQLLTGKHHLGVTNVTFHDHSYAMHVNALGLRSAEDIPYKKPLGHFRILALGDSFTEGKGVNDEETFCHLVGHQLNRISGKAGRITYEMLNAGVSSFVPVLEYLYLKTKGIKFEPDFVILFYDMSDLVQTRKYLKDAEFDSTGEVIRVPPPVDSWRLRLKTFVKSRFYFMSVLYKKIFVDSGKKEAAIGEPTRDLMLFSLSVDQTPWFKDWQRVFSDIEMMRAFCRERNIGFAVVIYPWGHQVNNAEWDLDRKVFGIPADYTAPAAAADMMVRELKVRRIDTLNLFPVFRNYQGSARLYFRHDMHWNKEGHALAAGQVTEFLKTRIPGL